MGRPKIMLDEKLLYDAYIIHGYSTYKIASMLGTTQTAVLRNLQDYNIPRRSKIDIAIEYFKSSEFSASQSDKIKNNWKNGIYADRILPKGEQHHLWTGGPVELICNYCGKVFYQCKSHGNRKYCSRHCMGKVISAGSNNANWQGGIGSEPYSPEFTKIFKTLIKCRDNNTCMVCGNTILKHFVVHHIDYDKKNTEISNCITLCNSCHSKTNFSRDAWLERFRTLLSMLYGYAYEERIA